MKRYTRVIPLVLIGLVSALTLTAGGGGKKKTTIWPAGEAKWVDNPSIPGASMATLWGDPSKGAYAALKKAPAGTDFGWHTHSNDQKVVAVGGTFEFEVEGQDAKELAPGSYIFLPGKTKHKTACKAGADCVWFEEQPGKADFVAVK